MLLQVLLKDLHFINFGNNSLFPFFSNLHILLWVVFKEKRGVSLSNVFFWSQIFQPLMEVQGRSDRKINAAWCQSIRWILFIQFLKEDIESDRKSGSLCHTRCLIPPSLHKILYEGTEGKLRRVIHLWYFKLGWKYVLKTCAIASGCLSPHDKWENEMHGYSLLDKNFARSWFLYNRSL